MGDAMNMFIVRKVLLAGLCGGLAEVLWVALYASMSSVSGTEVARQVAVTVFPGAADLAAAPVLGIAVHLVLSLALGAIFAWAVWIPFARRLDFPAAMMTALATLLAVWAVNFFVILPVLNPRFVTLMPYGASLISKALFGIAMAWALEYGQERRRRSPSIGPIPGLPGWGVSSRR
jgi:hypothetical protein